MNIIWLRTIQRIGGVEEFVFQIAKNYPYNLTVYYKDGSLEQIARLKKYCRVRKWNGEKVKCDTFISNYDISMIDFVDAKEYIQVIHASYLTQKLEPHLHPKFTKYVAVSKNAQNEFIKLTGEKVELCYNPLFLDKEELLPCVLIGSFTRLSKEKGGDIIKRIVTKLDQEKVNYLWFIYSDTDFPIDSPNVVVKKPILGVTNLMASMDLIAQTSYSEGYSYTINQAKSMGKSVLYTPCPCFNEMSLNDKDIRVEFDCSNLDEVVNRIKEIKKPLIFKEINKSRWDELLNKEPSDYEGVKMTKVKCLETIFFDLIAKVQRRPDDVWSVEEDRAKELIEKGLVEEVKDVREEKVERTVKRTTRKAK